MSRLLVYALMPLVWLADTLYNAWTRARWLLSWHGDERRRRAQWLFNKE